MPNHPYKVRMDEDMEALVESVKNHGIITPVILRQKEDGRYECLRAQAQESGGTCKLYDDSSRSPGNDPGRSHYHYGTLQSPAVKDPAQ